ncbi:unnamed protein product [Rotaria socialis]
MAERKLQKVDQLQLLDPIKVAAIDSTGTIGSFYDGYRDRIQKELAWNSEDTVTSILQKTECVLKNGSKYHNGNFLHVINKPEGLHLSILSGLVHVKGIASLVNYPYPVNEYTRYLLYSYTYKEEQVSDKLKQSRKMSKSLRIPASATHIITGVSKGIDVIIVLRLPSESEIMTKIDEVLQRICFQLKNEETAFELNLDDENILGQITDTMVYSNIPSLMTLFTVRDACLYINEHKNESIYQPITYILQSKKWLYTGDLQMNAKFTSIPAALNTDIEQYLVSLSNTVKTIKHHLASFYNAVSYQYFEIQIREKQCKLQKLEKIHNQIIERIQQWIIDLRKGRTSNSKKDQLFQHSDHDDFLKQAASLQENIDILTEKEQFISKLAEQRFEYCNAIELNLTKSNYRNKLRTKLKKKNENNLILCTNDKLNKKNEAKLNNHCARLRQDVLNNQNVSLTYADFSYTSIELQDMEIITTPETNNRNDIKTKKKPSTEPTKSKTPTSTTPDSRINILLLGETGVGKSTFINAFVNYLKFKTFEDAQSNTPVVLIPVSFLITVGNNFEERVVKFGDYDTSNNEDFEHPGESVTQHCRTYEFHLSGSDEQKLCIIDTPGFGDTRGLDQDDLNMQDILEYISSLAHLNAVCFLLRPNSSKLHTFFRMCFIQLLDLLGPNVHTNIIFCFTNARSTFYSPGDTAPLLKNLLKSFSMNDIPFKRDNTFCFDNESFRYLVSLQDGIDFSNDEKHDYEMSWSTSAKESNRLIEYIQTTLIECRLDSEWKSIKRAQVEINHMIRPMLHVMQNILRNNILYEMNITNKSIEMLPKAIHRPASICLSCASYPILVGNFWIAKNIPHEFLKKCLSCNCLVDKHIPINYVINYEYSNAPVRTTQKEMIHMASQLAIVGAEFDYFLVRITHASRSSPFLSGLERIIDEENKLCESQTSNHLNVKQVKNLIEIQCIYEKRMKDLLSNQQLTDLSNIDTRIATIRKYPMIEKQLEIMKQTQEMMTELYEVSEG